MGQLRMMFQCSAGHKTKPGETRVLVPVEVRIVHNSHDVTNSKKKKFSVPSVGTEIIRELPYCVEHALQQPRAAIFDTDVLRKHSFVAKPSKEKRDE